MDTMITFEVHLSTLIGIAIIGGIVLGVAVAVLFRKRHELRALINDKL